MTGGGKSMRDALAGKELIGFEKSSEHDLPALQRASTAKVGPVKTPRKPKSSAQA